jgi:hypothetical protein
MNIIRCEQIITKKLSLFQVPTSFDHIDIKPENNIPDGTVSIEEIKQYCIDYEIKIKKFEGLISC